MNEAAKHQLLLDSVNSQVEQKWKQAQHLDPIPP